MTAATPQPENRDVDGAIINGGNDITSLQKSEDPESANLRNALTQLRKECSTHTTRPQKGNGGDAAWGIGKTN